MPEPKYRTRKWKKKWVRTPGGELIISYRKPKPKIAKCSNCKKPLFGIPRERPYKMRNLAKTKKRPERAYGGYLCGKCLKEKITNKAIETSQKIWNEDFSSVMQKQMFVVGIVCIKNCGRDAGNLAVVIKKIDENNVLIDGFVRRRRCNIIHLEPISFVKVKEDASHEEIIKVLDGLVRLN